MTNEKEDNDSLKLDEFDPNRKYKYGIYIHMNKTAGTSQRKIIKKHHDRIRVFDLIDIDKASELYNNKGKMKNCFVWTSVRNPYDRFVSIVKGWRSKPIHRYIKEDHISFEHILRMATIGHAIQWKLPWLTSKKWYNMKLAYPDIYGTSEFDMLDHLVPMHKVYENFKIFNIPLHFVLKYENIEKDWLVVSKALRLKNKLPHSNKSLYIGDSKNKNYKKNFQQYYTRNIHRELIQEIYNKDFKLFGYSKVFPEMEKHPLEILIYIYNKIFKRNPNDEELAQYLHWIPDRIPLLERELDTIKQLDNSINTMKGTDK